MEQVQRTVLDLIDSALRQTPVTVPDNTDWDAVATIGKRQGIIPLLYDAVCRGDFDVPAEVLKRMKTVALQSALMDQRQLHALRRLTDCFEQNGVDYMLLKGSVMKSYYPRSDMRMMGDADILIREEQLPQIRRLMSDLGYIPLPELTGRYDESWDKPHSLHVELHRMPVSPDNRDYFAYFQNGWQFAVASETRPHTFVMTPADHLMYLLVHFANHFRFGGIGLRHALDFHQLFVKEPDLRTGISAETLAQLRLTDFYRNLCATLDCWFDGGEETETVKVFSDDLFNRGSFGFRHAHEVADSLRLSKMQRRHRLLTMLFPPVWQMAVRYPILNRAKWLLPVMWLYRIGETVICRHSSIKKHMRSLRRVSAAEMAEYDRHLQSVGLDFHF